MYSTRDYRKCEAQFCDGKKRIEELEAENAALKDHLSDAQEIIQRMMVENAALKEERDEFMVMAKDGTVICCQQQHRIKQLREALEKPYWDNNAVEILALPDSTAELDAVMKDAERFNLMADNMSSTEFLSDLYRRIGDRPPTKLELCNALNAAMKEMK